MQQLYKFTVLLVFACFGFSTANAQTTILDETLLTQSSFGNFTPVSVTGFQNWYYSPQQYGAVCSGFSGGQSFENEDWLISPVMNLSETNNVQLTFQHTRGNASVMNVGVAQGWYKAFATANYTGSPATTQWVELTGLNQNITTAWEYINSGALTVPDAAKSQNSRIAFRYMSSAGQSATWQIKNVKVTGDPQGTNPGSGTTFKVTTWNVEWFGCTTIAPANDNLQLNNVASAMLSMNSDIYCLQEVTNTTLKPTLQSLLAILGTNNWGATIVPYNTDDCDQRQAIVYKKSRVQFIGAVELTSGTPWQGNSYAHNWTNGRFPVVYNMNLLSGSGAIPISLVNIHAKSEDNDAASYTRRQGASQALKTILDGTAYNTKNVIVIGDYNDYLIGTSSDACACVNSPYKNFIDDTANYNGITKNIIDVNTFFGVRPLISNMVISNELAGKYVANSAVQEVSLPQGIGNYYNTTSNHLPVSARFQFSTLSSPEHIITDNSWSIYPNPVKNELNLAFTETPADTDIAIYDVTGRQVLSQKLSNVINVSSLPDGMYILKIGSTGRKFIKQ